MIVRSLDGLAMVAAGLREPERALRLAAASTRLREVIAQPAYPIEQAELDRALASARQTLGENGIIAATAEGRAMTLDQVVAYALAEHSG